MTSISGLDRFLQNHPEFTPFISKTEDENSKWTRIIFPWKEIKPDQENTLEHIFTPLVNRENCDYYLDCTKKRIYMKFLHHTAYRPFDIVFKTIYHLAIPISIPHIIYKTIQESEDDGLTRGQIAVRCITNSCNSLVDIVRIPLYGVAFTIINIAALVIGPFAPSTLYTFREITGQLIISMYRGNPAEYRKDFPCFQPDNLNDLNHFGQKTFPDTEYPSDALPYEIGMNNYTRAMIVHWRRTYNPCIQLLGKLDPKKAFVSSSYEPKADSRVE